MPTEGYLQKRAAELVKGAHYQMSGLQREILDLEASLADKKAKLNAANLAQNRLANFQITIGREYQCPDCWIIRGVHADLRPVGGGGDKEDRFRCNICNILLSVPE